MPWWVGALQASIAGVATSVFAGWLERSRRGRTRQSGQLSLPFAILLLGAACFTLFAGAALISNLYPNESVSWLTTTGLILFALMGLPLIWAHFIDRHEVSESALTFTTFFALRKTMCWSEVKSIRYEHGMSWFRIDAQSGVTARLSGLLRGLPDFARIALRQVPPHAFDVESFELLSATASGKPPPVAL